MNVFQRLNEAVERALPSRGSMHYLMAKTYYQAAIYSAHWGSEYWFGKAREGFDAHAEGLRAIQKESGRSGDAPMAGATRHCQHLALGLKDAAKVGRQIRQLLMIRYEGNAKNIGEKIHEHRETLKYLRGRLRRPGAR